MSTSLKGERSALSHEEYETVLASHHPGIYDLDGKSLHELRVRLRGLRDKERTLARQKRREKRGKADARGGSFPGTQERPQLRKQIFAAAVKRVNKELERHRKLDAREANVEAAKRALAVKRANKFVHRPPPGRTADEGMQPIENMRRRKTIPGAKIGSIQKQTQAAQAKRDAR